MQFEKIVQLLIYTHAALGGIALLAGSTAIIAVKGSLLHRCFGKIFFYCMLASAFVSFIVAVSPGHYNPSLFAIGVFSSYFLISGYGSLRFKEVDFHLNADKGIAYLVIITGTSMILYPLLLAHKINIVLTVFGLAAVYFGARDLIAMRNPRALQKNWLKHHLGKMTGGYIAAVTAFLVVNNVLPSIWGWFAPSLFGVPYIVFWSQKMSVKKMAK